MAKINGLYLKKVRKDRGHEGEPVYSGEIWLQKTCVGSFRDSYMCGPRDVKLHGQYEYKKLEELVKTLHKKQDDIFIVKSKDKEEIELQKSFADIFNIEILLQDLLTLTDWEKKYKKGIKKYGNDSMMVIATDDYHEYEIWYDSKNQMDRLDIIEDLDQENLEFFKDKIPNFHVFTSTEDFNLHQEIKLSDITKKQRKREQIKER